MRSRKPIRASGVRLEDILPQQEPVDHRKRTHWIARVPLLKIKPIVHSDPVVFLQIINQLKKEYPNLHIYIFKVVRE